MSGFLWEVLSGLVTYVFVGGHFAGDEIGVVSAEAKDRPHAEEADDCFDDGGRRLLDGFYERAAALG